MNTRLLKKATAIALAATLGACAIVPSGPSRLALPGSKRSFDEFRVDDARCRASALDSSGGKSAAQNAVDSSVATAVLGTVIGIAAGAAIGGSRGAGVGAGAGLLIGSSVGTAAADQSYRGTQRDFDQFYFQCMYAAGHRVPVSGRLSEASVRPPIPAPPAGSPPPPPGSVGIPRPPAGLPPPPPANAGIPAPPTGSPPPPPPPGSVVPRG